MIVSNLLLDRATPTSTAGDGTCDGESTCRGALRVAREGGRLVFECVSCNGTTTEVAA